MSSDTPPSLDWLYNALYRLIYAVFHAFLSFFAALLCNRPSVRSIAPLPQHNDPERGEVDSPRQQRITYTPSPLPASRRRANSHPHMSQPQHFQQSPKLPRPSSAKKFVQFETPKRRTAPPLGRIDLLSSSAGSVHRSFDKFKASASNPRAQHATYFLE